MGLGQSRICKCIEEDLKNAEIDAKIRKESRRIAKDLEEERSVEFKKQWTTTPIKVEGGGKKLRKTKKNKTKNNKTKKRHYKKRKTKNRHK
jgi:hypothetical protein